MKVAFCTRARTSNEVKISIEAARLACPESKDETHLLPFPLFVPFAEFNPTDQCVVCRMSVRTEIRILVNASERLTKTFPRSVPSLADVNGRAATAGDAVNQTRGQTSEGVCNRYVILWPQKIKSSYIVGGLNTLSQIYIQLLNQTQNPRSNKFFQVHINHKIKPTFPNPYQTQNPIPRSNKKSNTKVKHGNQIHNSVNLFSRLNQTWKT